MDRYSPSLLNGKAYVYLSIYICIYLSIYVPNALKYIQTGRGSPVDFHSNSIHPYSLFRAAGASSSAVCAACSPGTYLSSAGAKAWSRVKSEIWAS